MPEAARRELERCKRVADQMVSAHATLEQRNRRFAAALDVGLMAASFVLVIASVVALFRAAVQVLSIRPNLGVLTVSGSAFVLMLSIVEWRVRWKVIASRHGEARKEYSKIKLKIQRALSGSTPGGSLDVAGILEEYQQIGTRVVSIPEGKFLALKQAHLRKVYVSRLLDKYLVAIRWLVARRARFRHSVSAMADDGDD